MSDVVTCKCVLKKRAEPGVQDRLVVEANGVRFLPCHPKGEARRHPPESGPEWEYEEREGRLYITPSMLCLSTGFHTAYNWDVDYAPCPDDMGAYEHFLSLNPSLAP